MGQVLNRDIQGRRLFGGEHTTALDCLSPMATWVVERTQDRRFPFRITIEQGGRTLLAVRAQNHWPGAGSQIFCLRETELDPAEALEPFERVPVAHLTRLGRKLSVTLDRAQRKRCEFLKIEKRFKDRPGTYEQIFFRTEQGVRAHRTSGRVELVPRGGLDVVIDSAELYPWKFPGARVTRRKLPVGDYALVEDERLVAVVERKTRENLLGNVHEIKGLHQQLAELGSYPHAAMVVEAQYADFGNPAKIGRWPASHLLRVIGELAALHPTVPLVFAGNRKLANVWAQRFFAGVAAAQYQSLPAFVGEPLARFDAEPADGGTDTRVRIAALRELPDGFEFALLRRQFAEVGELRLRRVLNQLRAEGRLRCEGRGRAARWLRC
jgi:hypothetical protein